MLHTSLEYRDGLLFREHGAENSHKTRSISFKVLLTYLSFYYYSPSPTIREKEKLYTQVSGLYNLGVVKLRHSGGDWCNSNSNVVLFFLLLDFSRFG